MQSCILLIDSWSGQVAMCHPRASQAPTTGQPHFYCNATETSLAGISSYGVFQARCSDLSCMDSHHHIWLRPASRFNSLCAGRSHLRSAATIAFVVSPTSTVTVDFCYLKPNHLEYFTTDLHENVLSPTIFRKTLIFKRTLKFRHFKKIMFSHHKAVDYTWECGNEFLVTECFSWRQPARIREEALESRNLVSWSWIQPLYRVEEYNKINLKL